MIAPDDWVPMSVADVEALPANAHTRLTLAMLLAPVAWVADQGERDAAFTVECLALAEYRRMVTAENPRAIRPGETVRTYSERLSRS